MELRYIERFVFFMKKVNNQIPWKFELGSRGNMNVPLWIIKGFQQKTRQDSQDLIIHTFCRLPVTSAQCIVGTEKHPDAGLLLKFDYGD